MNVNDAGAFTSVITAHGLTRTFQQAFSKAASSPR